MKISRTVNDWLGYNGGWAQFPENEYRTHVVHVFKRKNTWWLRTSSGNIVKALPNMVIEHGVRINDSVTLE